MASVVDQGIRPVNGLALDQTRQSHLAVFDAEIPLSRRPRARARPGDVVRAFLYPVILQVLRWHIRRVG